MRSSCDAAIVNTKHEIDKKIKWWVVTQKKNPKVPHVRTYIGNQRWKGPFASNAHMQKIAVKAKCSPRPGSEVIKKILINSAEHEISDTHKYKNIKKFSFFQAQISI